MWQQERFDPLAATDSEKLQTSERKQGSVASTHARKAGNQKKKTNHLSGAERRARAKAKQEGTAVGAGRHPTKPSAVDGQARHRAGAGTEAEYVPRPIRVTSSDPRRRPEKRRVQDRLDKPNPLPKFLGQRLPDNADDGVPTSTTGDELGGAQPAAPTKRRSSDSEGGQSSKGAPLSKPIAEQNSAREAQTTYEAAAVEHQEQETVEEGRQIKEPRKKKKKKKMKQAEEDPEQIAKPSRAFELVQERAKASQQAQERAKASQPAAVTKNEADQDRSKGENEAAAKLTLNELQERLATATSSRPTPQYLNEEQQLEREQVRTAVLRFVKI